MNGGELQLPRGTVTLLFTDIEGSTRLLLELGRDAYVRALTEHRRLLREAFNSHGGVEVEMQGDSFHFAFPYARDAVAAAVTGQRALAEHAWESKPIKVRIGLHTGEPMQADGLYAGLDVHWAARVMSVGHGGQVLLSARTADLVEGELPTGITLRDLGDHRLKDLTKAQRLYQVGTHEFPPLKTLARSNLPVPTTSFVGRERELGQVGELLVNADVRLLTLTGPGGAGKTRLAIHAARQATPSFPDGVHWVALAALRDPELVVGTISETLAAAGDLSEHIGRQRLLIVLDNFEQVIEAAPHLGALLAKCPSLTMLVTSRETLRVQAEVEFSVPPLVEGDAVGLFCTRSGLEPTPDVSTLCTRLDSLPLAVELAAARTKALSPAQILDRLSQRLDLLKGGRDADPRQRTLRATIEWSFDLLSGEEQRLFARLSVFAGGFTLEAAEVVAEADVDSLQSLVEKSLVRLTAERYWLLETIRDFAAEQLEQSRDNETVRGRHAAYVLDLAAELEAASVSDRERARFGAEQDNFRQALAWAEQAGRTDVQLELIGRTWPFWWYRGLPAEGLRWVESAVTPSGGERSARKAKVLAAGAMFAYRLNDLDTTRSYAENSLEMARSLGDTRGTSWPLVLLGLTASELGDFARATALYEQAIAAAQEASDTKLVGIALNNLGVIATRQADYIRSVSLFERALAISRELGTSDEVALESYNLARSLHHTGDTRRAVDTALESLVLAHEIGNRITLFDALALLSALALTEGRAKVGARLMGAAEALREQGGCEQEADEAAFLDTTTADLNRELGLEAYVQAHAEGKAMPLDEAVANAQRLAASGGAVRIP